MDIRSEMLSRLRGRKPGYSLDQPFYIDPDFHKLDMETIWYRGPAMC
ncbi:MAG: ring hydroxylating dioxygenase subunit [Rhizobium sp.]|nr:ring hydroxylating dioxygenase subunit [Rhizobium sp.]